ncbi:MAG: hypothetical protein WCD51_15155 [Anaerolineae bacterium]
MMIARNRRYVLLVAGLVLIFVAGACLPGGTVSPTSPPEEVATATTPPSAPPAAPTNTPPVVAGATPTQPAAAGVLRQWATGATASSQYGDDDYSAQQAIGAPNTMDCGDHETAWASQTSEGVDWLEVTFATAVVPTEINIYETYSPGAINKVEVKDEAGLYYTVWQGTPATVEQCPRVFTVSVSGVSAPVKAVRINLDQREGPYWNEIDAVELVGVPSGAPPVVPAATPTQPPVAGAVRQWAVGGVASSSYSDPDWGAQQATGAPNVTECVDDQRAWASETAEGVDWLEVTFATAVVPTEINIHESVTPGFINKVEVKDQAGLYYTVWQGTPGAVQECPRVFTVSVSGVSARVNTVRISLDQRNAGYWDEIDAVELVGQP